MKINNENVSYSPADKKQWSGRKTNKSLGEQYWYQAIKCVDLESEALVLNADVALVGYVCDEGVRRNLGRVGAKKGSSALRDRLGKVALHTNKKLIDVGNIICKANYLEQCQTAFSKTITLLIENKIFPIAIGGGHDIAYAHYNGIYKALKNKVKSIGIINFDAHFDLRPVETTPNSGTPFYQILSEMALEDIKVNYLPIGIQKQANTLELFEIAKQKKVSFIDNFSCDFLLIKEQLSKFIDKNEAIYITIDVDGFSSAYAPGVSAPSPLGFTPKFVMQSLEFLFGSKKVVSCDFAELNPAYDIDNQTANLVSRLVDFIVTLK